MSQKETIIKTQNQSGSFSKLHPQIVNYVAGLGAGLVSTTLGFPLDVIRVRYLFGQSTASLFNGFTFAFIYSVGKSGLVWPIQKNVQQYVENHFEGKSAHIISGAIGNVIPGIIFNPCNIIKVRYMESPKKVTLREILKNIKQNEGYSVFTRGFSVTIFRDLTWGLLYFPIFNHVKELLADADKKSPPKDYQGWILIREDRNAILSSASAACFSTLFTSFLDGARLFQQRSLDPKTGHHSFIKSLRMATLPSRRNFVSIVSGVGRVAVTTVFGHFTYLKISSFIHDKES